MLLHILIIQNVYILLEFHKRIICTIFYMSPNYQPKRQIKIIMSRINRFDLTDVKISYIYSFGIAFCYISEEYTDNDRENMERKYKECKFIK